MPAARHEHTDAGPSAAQMIVDADRDEAAWLARAAEGDLDGAFVALYRRYEGRVYGLGLRMLGDGDLAEELVQETFTRLWRGAGAYDPAKGTVRTYLLTIARRTAIGLWRRPSSRPIAPAPSWRPASRTRSTRSCSASACATRWGRCRPSTARCSTSAWTAT